MVPNLGDKVDWCIGMSYWPVRLNRLAGRLVRKASAIRQLYPPVRDYEFEFSQTNCINVYVSVYIYNTVAPS
jgi:hypothetical protein